MPDATPTIDGRSVVSRSQSHVEANVDAETVLMQIDSGRFFSLGGTARRAWELIATPIKVDTLVDTLLNEYAVDRELCMHDIIALCGALSERGLIDVAS